MTPTDRAARLAAIREDVARQRTRNARADLTWLLGEVTKTCEWSKEQDDYDTWQASCCDNVFQFTDDGPRANGFTRCPYCGGTLTEAETEAHDA